MVGNKVTLLTIYRVIKAWTNDTDLPKVPSLSVAFHLFFQPQVGQLQLTLEQRGCELPGSTCTWMIFNK